MKQFLAFAVTSLLLTESASADVTYWTCQTDLPSFVTETNWSNGAPTTNSSIAWTQDAVIEGSFGGVANIDCGGNPDHPLGAGQMIIGDQHLTVRNDGKLHLGHTNVIFGNVGSNASVIVDGNNSAMSWNPTNVTGGFKDIAVSISNGANVYRMGTFSGGSLAVSGGLFTMNTASGAGVLSNLTSFTMSSGHVTARQYDSAANAQIGGGRITLTDNAAPILGSGYITLGMGSSIENELISTSISYFDTKLMINGKEFPNAVEGLDYTISGNVLTVIPEPSTYALIAGGGALGVALIARRRKHA